MTGARHGTRRLGNKTTVVVGMTQVALDNVPTVGFAGATTTQRETADSTLTLYRNSATNTYRRPCLQERGCQSE